MCPCLQLAGRSLCSSGCRKSGLRNCCAQGTGTSDRVSDRTSCGGKPITSELGSGGDSILRGSGCIERRQAVAMSGAFVPPSVLVRPRCRAAVRCRVEHRAKDGSVCSRRSFLHTVAGLVVATALPGASEARVLPKSREELMDEMKSKKSGEEIEAEKEKKAEERRKRLERQKALLEDQEKKKLEGKTDAESDIDANLRANYYYPTARKRYLPRIKECNDKIAETREAVQAGDWKKIAEFLEGPGDRAAGPLKLYASSLAGQGLSLKVAYVEEMATFAQTYEDQLKALTKAAKKKKKDDAIKAFDKLDGALQGYRKAARIDTPDGGIGEIPTDKRLGSGFSNLLPRGSN